MAGRAPTLNRTMLESLAESQRTREEQKRIDAIDDWLKSVSALHAAGGGAERPAPQPALPTHAVPPPAIPTTASPRDAVHTRTPKSAPHGAKGAQHFFVAVVRFPTVLDTWDLLYEIDVQTNVPVFDVQRSTVFRRYSHFTWLRRILGTRRPLPPPLPAAATRTSISLSDVEVQRRQLEAFLMHVASNPKHQSKEALLFFLQAPVEQAQLNLLVQLDGRRDAPHPAAAGEAIDSSDSLTTLTAASSVSSSDGSPRRRLVKYRRSDPSSSNAEDERSVALSSVTTGGDAQSLLPTDWQPVAASITRPGSPPAASRGSSAHHALSVSAPVPPRTMPAAATPVSQSQRDPGAFVRTPIKHTLHGVQPRHAQNGPLHSSFDSVGLDARDQPGQHSPDIDRWAVRHGEYTHAAHAAAARNTHAHSGREHAQSLAESASEVSKPLSFWVSLDAPGQRQEVIPPPPPVPGHISLHASRPAAAPSMHSRKSPGSMRQENGHRQPMRGSSRVSPPSIPAGRMHPSALTSSGRARARTPSPSAMSAARMTQSLRAPARVPESQPLVRSTRAAGQHPALSQGFHNNAPSSFVLGGTDRGQSHLSHAPPAQFATSVFPSTNGRAGGGYEQPTATLVSQASPRAPTALPAPLPAAAGQARPGEAHSYMHMNLVVLPEDGGALDSSTHTWMELHPETD